MKRTAFRWLALLMILTLIPCAGLAEAAAPETEQAVHTVEARTYPYLRSFSDDEPPVEGEMTLYFIDGADDIPFVPLSFFLPFYSSLLTDVMKWDPIQFEITRAEAEDGTADYYFCKRADNEAVMMVFPSDGTITFTDFNTFTAAPGVRALVNVLDIPTPEKGDLMALWEMSKQTNDPEALTALFMQQLKEPERSFFVGSGTLYNRGGGPLTLCPADYNIPMYSIGGECYLPFQTLNDLFLANAYILIVFNGEKVFCQQYGCTLLDQALQVPGKPMSEAFAAFNSNELFFAMDTFYGLKPEHGITSFADLAWNNQQLFERLTGTDASAFDTALATLTMTYLDDLHSGFLKGSWYSTDEDITGDVLRQLTSLGYSTVSNMRVTTTFENARKEVFPDGVPGYQEIGDTAFVTFDEFSVEFDDHDKYYDVGIPASLEECTDAMRLLIYSHAQVTRENSPVKNVVLDLSCNGGGDSAVAVATVCWFLGEGFFALRDTLTGAQTIMGYRTDLNLDGINSAEGGDSLENLGIELYCLISPVSFSCGNLVPAVFRDSGRVTLIGQRSGGGSCVVLPLTSASGAQFRISGTKQISVAKNGAFYNVDDGIEPDVQLVRPASYYDRDYLVQMIHELR